VRERGRIAGLLGDDVPGEAPELLGRVVDGARSGRTPGLGLFRQRTELSKSQHNLLAKLDIPAPKQIIELAARR